MTEPTPQKPEAAPADPLARRADETDADYVVRLRQLEAELAARAQTAAPREEAEPRPLRSSVRPEGRRAVTAPRATAVGRTVRKARDRRAVGERRGGTERRENRPDPRPGDGRPERRDGGDRRDGTRDRRWTHDRRRARGSGEGDGPRLGRPDMASIVQLVLWIALIVLVIVFLL